MYLTAIWNYSDILLMCMNKVGWIAIHPIAHHKIKRGDAMPVKLGLGIVCTYLSSYIT